MDPALDGIKSDLDTASFIECHRIPRVLNHLCQDFMKLMVRFNQMLGLNVNSGAPAHIRDFDFDILRRREITVRDHCYSCTAGAGSSCQGALTST